jgi:hypothetical protein
VIEGIHRRHAAMPEQASSKGSIEPASHDEGILRGT